MKKLFILIFNNRFFRSFRSKRISYFICFNWFYCITCLFFWLFFLFSFDFSILNVYFLNFFNNVWKNYSLLTPYENTILDSFLIFSKNNKGFLLDLKFINVAKGLFYHSLFHIPKDELQYSFNYFKLSTDAFFEQNFFLAPDSKNIPNCPRRFYDWLHDWAKISNYSYNSFSEMNLYPQNWYHPVFFSVDSSFRFTLSNTSWYDPRDFNRTYTLYEMETYWDYLFLWKPFKINIRDAFNELFPGQKHFMSTKRTPHECMILGYNRHAELIYLDDLFIRYWLTSPEYTAKVFRPVDQYVTHIRVPFNKSYEYKSFEEYDFVNAYRLRKKKFDMTLLYDMFDKKYNIGNSTIKNCFYSISMPTRYKFDLVYSYKLNTLFSKNYFNFYNLVLLCSIDNLSLLFILLVITLFPLCLLFAWRKIKYKFCVFILLMLALQIQLFFVFSVTDLFYFYIFFESVLIPMFLIIGIWGSRKRKTHAAFMFFFYTFIGSLLMLFNLFIIYSNLHTTNLLIIMDYDFTENRAKILWLFFFIAFCIKIPMFPFHIRLPEAHVEAPTIGSVLLAGILLKLGTYGFLRYCVLLFPYATYYYTPLIYTLSFLAIFYSTLTTVRQIDLKKIIAYASIAHMNYVVLGILSLTNYGLAGSIFLMISHGFVSSGLFFLIGFIYDRYKTRILLYYGGLSIFMPKFTIFFLLFTLANISFPGTSNFIGEFLVLLGLYNDNKIITFLSTAIIVFGAIYSIWLCNRLLFGGVNKNIFTYCDLLKFEVYILLNLSFFIIFLGLYPNFFLQKIELFIYNILEIR